MSFSLRSTAVSSCALLALLVTAEAANTSRAQADSFAKKLAIINQHAARVAEVVAPHDRDGNRDQLLVHLSLAAAAS